MRAHIEKGFEMSLYMDSLYSSKGMFIVHVGEYTSSLGLVKGLWAMRTHTKSNGLLVTRKSRRSCCTSLSR